MAREWATSHDVDANAAAPSRVFSSEKGRRAG